MAVETLLGNRLEGGLVVVKEKRGCQAKKVRIRVAGHPLPDKRSERAGKDILDLVRSLTREDLLIVVMSGGASSLLVAPIEPVPLSAKQKTTNLLLRSGASIQEINAIRKHLSAIKGGRLAEATSATIIGLALSDVLGDDLSIIGSGPTAPDSSTFQQAKSVFRTYGLWKGIPSSVRGYIEKGIRGAVPETPKPRSPLFRRVHNHVIGNNAVAVERMATTADALGFHPVVLSTTLTGEAREVGRMVGTLAKNVHASGSPLPGPVCFIWGGELTVTLTGKSKGGRAQEFALSAAQEIAGLRNVIVAGFGTDGTDGPTDVAGAVVDGQTVARAKKKGLDAATILKRHDSYSFFKRAGGHIISGPTGTNVNDIYLLIAL